MNKSNRAEELFRMGYNCCQSVFGAFCDEFELELDETMTNGELSRLARGV